MIGARHELQRFEHASALPAVSAPDQRLWSPERLRAWRDAALGETAPPLAVLRIRGSASRWPCSTAPTN